MLLIFKGFYIAPNCVYKGAPVCEAPGRRYCVVKTETMVFVQEKQEISVNCRNAMLIYE